MSVFQDKWRLDEEKQGSLWMFGHLHSGSLQQCQSVPPPIWSLCGFNKPAEGEEFVLSAVSGASAVETEGLLKQHCGASRFLFMDRKTDPELVLSRE